MGWPVAVSREVEQNAAGDWGVRPHSLGSPFTKGELGYLTEGVGYRVVCSCWKWLVPPNGRAEGRSPLRFFPSPKSGIKGLKRVVRHLNVRMNMEVTDITERPGYTPSRGGATGPGQLELLSKGADLSGKLGSGLVAVLAGSGVENLAPELLSHGADKVYVIDDPRLEHYQNQAYAAVIADLVKEHKPEIFLLGATAIGEDLAPCIAPRWALGSRRTA